MPASAKAALAAILAASILRAFFGEPPSSAHRGDALRAGLAGAACYAGAVLAAYYGNDTVASALIVAAVEALCLTVWLMRGRDDPGGGTDEPEPDPPVDWEEFDRERERWSRPRVPI